MTMVRSVSACRQNNRLSGNDTRLNVEAGSVNEKEHKLSN